MIVEFGDSLALSTCDSEMRIGGGLKTFYLSKFLEDMENTPGLLSHDPLRDSSSFPQLASNTLYQP